MFTVPTDAEKDAVWKAYRAGRPTRVPLVWGVNPRIILLDPAINTDRWTFEQLFGDPPIALAIQSRFQQYVATVLSQTADMPAALPDRWTFGVENQNVYDAAYFGAEVVFEPDQVPISRAPYTLDDLDAFLDRDFSHPLENPWLKSRIEMHTQLVKAAESFEYLGRGGDVSPLALGFDGPLTCAASLFGDDAFYLFCADPEKAHRLMMTITRAAIVRNRALGDLAGGWKPDERGGLADDSIQLISPDQYRDTVMPAHALWYDEMSATRAEDFRRNMHLCGDATRHFKTLHDELGIDVFDTGFPVDHGALRRELGPAVTIQGGPRVDVLLSGTPEECARVTGDILTSGVTDGGRFMLREANNLPPCCPIENLQAVYNTCLECGRYETA
jgi:uroporphyrinogen-III decarboxylase